VIAVGDQDTQRFEWIVRAIAQPAEIQQTLFPPYVVVADELAMEFEEHLRKLQTAGLSSVFNEDEERLVMDLDAKLAAISGPKNLRFWTDEALSSAPEWDEIRRAASAVLDKMGWSKAPPPADRGDVYVGPHA
jgi:hypothetical protein